MDSNAHARPGSPMDPHVVLADGQLPECSQDAQRHQVVADELLRGPCLEDALGIECDDGHISANC
jgi:hypothetical protein